MKATDNLDVGLASIRGIQSAQTLEMRTRAQLAERRDYYLLFKFNHEVSDEIITLLRIDTLSQIVDYLSHLPEFKEKTQDQIQTDLIEKGRAYPNNSDDEYILIQWRPDLPLSEEGQILADIDHLSGHYLVINTLLEESQDLVYEYNDETIARNKFTELRNRMEEEENGFGIGYYQITQGDAPQFNMIDYEGP